jgi:hypothetical protein
VNVPPISVLMGMAFCLDIEQCTILGLPTQRALPVKRKTA